MSLVEHHKQYLSVRFSAIYCNKLFPTVQVILKPCIGYISYAIVLHFTHISFLSFYFILFFLSYLNMLFYLINLFQFLYCSISIYILNLNFPIKYKSAIKLASTLFHFLIVWVDPCNVNPHANILS